MGKKIKVLEKVLAMTAKEAFELFKLNEEIKVKNARLVVLKEKARAKGPGVYKVAGGIIQVEKGSRPNWDTDKLNDYLGDKIEDYKKVSRFLEVSTTIAK